MQILNSILDDEYEVEVQLAHIENMNLLFE